MYNLRKTLSEDEIMQRFEGLDDSDADDDYQPGSEEDASDTDNEEEMSVRVKGGPDPEIRIFMEPPVERPDADTDCDSGKFIMNYYNCNYYHGMPL